MGEVKGFYKTHLFVLLKEDLAHKHLLRSSNGYYAVETRCVVLAGADIL